MPSDASTTLIRKRANLKSQLTRFRTFLENCSTEQTKRGLKQRLENIKLTWQSFDDIQNQIEELDETTDHSLEREEFENSYYDVVPIAEEYLLESETTITAAASMRSGTMEPNQNGSTAMAHVKLPTINLPTFSGSYEAWLGFYDTFKAMIHENDSIMDVQKLHYLKSCLKGDAAQIVESLDSSAESYTIAWALLKERYDNRRIITQSHLRALFELPTSQRESQSSIRALLDNLQKHTRALKSLGQLTWESLLIYLVTTKLDKISHTDWERSIKGSSMPSMDDLVEFLRHRCQTLEALNPESSQRKPIMNSGIREVNTQRVRNQQVHVATRSQSECVVCKQTHNLQDCEQFQRFSLPEKTKIVTQSKRCFNCLRTNHQIRECTAGRCRKCQRKHHTLLHPEQDSEQTPTPVTANLASLQAVCSSEVLLSTAIVDMLDHRGKQHSCRILLDSGSQSNFMTEKLATILQLAKNNINIPVSGLSEMSTQIKHSVTTMIKSRQNAFQVKQSFLLLPRITGQLPSYRVNKKLLDIPQNIKLADPKYHQPSEIDALLGAEIFYNLLCVGQIKLANQTVILQKTHLGWVISGKFRSNAPTANRTSCHLSTEKINSQVEKFWEIEEGPSIKRLSEEEQNTESHFQRNVQRDDTGRYTVKLPFNEKINALGDSYNITLKRFYTLERKLQQNPELKAQYSDFLEEYLRLGHMSKVQETSQKQGYYLPHHAVIKESSLTTKVRVVFDGSAKTTSGVSLNDTLLVGPTIQDDIVSLIIRFRSYTYALTADIEKMYRQINLSSEDRIFQRILWRSNDSEPIETYQLNTVTYGTASAPFLAIRSLHQLANDEAKSFPHAASVIKRDFYVDDLLTGASSINEAAQLRDDLKKVLSKGGFELRQWASNEPVLVKTLPHEATNSFLRLDPSSAIKPLGIHWKSNQDSIVYTVNNKNSESRLTKRSIPSGVAQLFDSLGLVEPVTVEAKILMQRLWQVKTNWDKSVPLDIHTAWLDYKNQLTALKHINKNNTCAELVVNHYSPSNNVKQTS